MKARAPATAGDSTLKNVRNPEGCSYFTNMSLSAILHYAGVADDPEIANAGKFGQNVILNTIGKNCVLFAVAQTFER